LEKRITTVISQLQILLRDAVSLVQGRDSCYIIDPDGILVTTLKGSSSLYELNLSWAVLRERIQRGQAKFEKYDSEYQGLNPLLSVSTDSEIYESLKAKEELGISETLSAFLLDIPSHFRSLPHPIQDAIKDGQDLRTILGTPEHLKSAFLPRHPETHPLQVMYNEEGRKITSIPRDPPPHLAVTRPLLESRAKQSNANVHPHRNADRHKTTWDPSSIPLPLSDKSTTPA
jgi:hypothetical protein